MAHLLADPFSCFFRYGEGQLGCHANNIFGDRRNCMIPQKKLNPRLQRKCGRRLNSHRSVMRNSTPSRQSRGDEGLISKRLKHLRRTKSIDENRNAAA